MWHIKTVEEVYKKLKSSIDGLTQKEAEKRLKQNGLNTLSKGKKNGLVKIFLMQFATSTYSHTVFVA